MLLITTLISINLGTLVMGRGFCCADRVPVAPSWVACAACVRLFVWGRRQGRQGGGKRGMVGACVVVCVVD
jgi:hypothetical protein